MISRRALLVFVLAALPIGVACKRESRCANCGMKLDMTSPWRTDLVSASGKTLSFDAPRCALMSWRSGATAAERLRVQDFYERAWHDGSEVRFVVGSDVLGPMGADLIAVTPERVAKFTKDHGGHALALGEITSRTLEEL